MENNTHFAIKYWSEEDRPREKLINLGRQNLSNTELLAILLGSGTKNLSALQLARTILQKVDQNLHQLGKLSLKEFYDIKGIGPAKAVCIIAAIELGRRRQLADVRSRKKIQSSQDAYEVLAPILIDNYKEEFWLALLNRANECIKFHRLSVGGVSGTVVDAKLVFKTAIENLASSIILYHNHPSGNLNPSEADHRITRNLVQSGQLMDIRIIDHLIISEKGYYSFADEGQI